MEKKHQNVEKITTRQWALEFNQLIGRKVFYIPSKFSYKQHGLFTFILYAGQRFDKIDMLPVKDLNIFDSGYKTFFNSDLTAEELADICWSNLNEDNKVSLFVRCVPLDGSEPTEIIINKNV